MPSRTAVSVEADPVSKPHDACTETSPACGSLRQALSLVQQPPPLLTPPPPPHATAASRDSLKLLATLLKKLLAEHDRIVVCSQTSSADARLNRSVDSFALDLLSTAVATFTTRVAPTLQLTADTDFSTLQQESKAVRQQIATFRGELDALSPGPNETAVSSGCNADDGDADPDDRERLAKWHSEWLLY